MFLAAPSRERSDGHRDRMYVSRRESPNRHPSVRTIPTGHLPARLPDHDSYATENVYQSANWGPQQPQYRPQQRGRARGQYRGQYPRDNRSRSARRPHYY